MVKKKWLSCLKVPPKSANFIIEDKVLEMINKTSLLSCNFLVSYFHQEETISLQIYRNIHSYIAGIPVFSSVFMGATGNTVYQFSRAGEYPILL